MAGGTALAWASWVAVLWNVNPDEAGIPGFVLFYLTLCVALIGTFSVLGVVYRVHVLKRQHVVSREVRIAFRHAILLASMAVSSLALSTYGWLKWWVFLLLLALVGVIEYAALTIQESKRH